MLRKKTMLLLKLVLEFSVITGFQTGVSDAGSDVDNLGKRGSQINIQNDKGYIN